MATDTPTWCPQCGPGVSIDEDGCCMNCGSTSTGPGADEAVRLLSFADEYNVRVAEKQHEINQFRDLAETAWGIVANVSGGDWSQQSAVWQTAAARWRDAYHATLPHRSDAPDATGGE